MVTVEPISPGESNGPDECRGSLKCKTTHHAGQRTGFPDYCCCCHPCLYRAFLDPAAGNVHCCRCNPRLIVVRFGNEYDECCRTTVAVLFAELVLDATGQSVVRYSGSIVGYAITAFLSREPVDGGYSEPSCYWTIRIPELGIDEQIEIDHVTVTCLGVPDIQISNVPKGECTGTISLLNFAAEKVPFRDRSVEFPMLSEYQDLVVEVDACACTTAPRYLCVIGVRHVSGDSERAEFFWDDDFPAQPFEDGQILGRWEYTPEGDPYPAEFLYLVDTGYGCELRTDFEGPAGLRLDSDPQGELFPKIPLDGVSCGCSFKTTASHEVPGPERNLFITIRAGLCGCWDYHCGSCRCVPSNLCAVAFINGQWHKGLRLSWDGETKSWGGEVPYGVDSSEFAINLNRASDGSCEASLALDGVNPDPVSLDCGIFLSMSFSYTDPYSGDFTFVHAFSAVDPDCDIRFDCTDATPCAEDCGSHPEQLLLTLYGYNDPDLDEPGFYDECTLEVELEYLEFLAVTGPTEIEITCGYRGYVQYECDDPIFGIQRVQLEIVMSNGHLSITKRTRNEDDGFTGVSTESKDYVLAYELCDPYFAEVEEAPGLQTCFWGCDETIQRERITLVQAA